MKKVSLLLLLNSIALCTMALPDGQAGQKDSVVIKKFFNEALTNSMAYKNLDELTSQVGGRLSGSPQAAKAVEWSAKAMKEAGADTVWLQECWVPHWVRGDKEKGTIINAKGSQDVPVCALGGSIATSKDGLTATVIEVKDFDELKKLGKENIQGKIVFYNHPFDQTFVNTFEAYSEAGKYRYAGPSEASRYGAVGSVVRSMAQNPDDFPHAGAMNYNDSFPKIPCAAISTNGAELLSKTIKSNPGTKFFLKMNCETLDSVKSYNVIGEIKGSVHPEEIIDVGGHLDSWETGKGANDDGSGATQSIEVLRLFKATGMRPKRTIRAINFMNEENGLKGGRKYAEKAFEKKENHIAAMESDAGSFLPLGFGLNMPEDKKNKILAWKPLFIPYNIYNFSGSGDGADISPMTGKGVPGIGLQVNSQRYFDYHHAASDTFDKISRRELEMGAAAMAGLVYLLSEYGL